MVGVPHRPLLPSLTTVLPLPSEEGTTQKLQRESQGQNLALTVLHVPYLPDSGDPRFLSTRY